jgi:chromosome segregation protein
VVLVPDLETAVRLKREHAVLQFATLAGEFVSTAGVIFGGSVAVAADSLLGRKSLISETAAEVSQLTTELTAVHARREEMQGLVQSARGELEEARARHQAAHVAQSNSAAHLLLLGHELRAADDRLRQVQTERTTLEQQINVADRRVAELEQELASLSESVDEQQTRRASAAEASEQARMQEEETSAALQELRLAVATETQRHENLLSQRQPMAARAAELAEMIDARRADIRNYERRLEVQTIESEHAQGALEMQAGELAAAEERAAAISHERAERLAAVNSLDAELRATRNSLNELHDTRGKEQVRQTQLQLRVDNLLEHVTRRYQLDLREFSADHYAFQKTLRVQLKRRNRPADPSPASLSPAPRASKRLRQKRLPKSIPRSSKR